MLLQWPRNPILIIYKPFVNLHNLFEIEFLKVNVEPPDEKVHQVALLQLATPHAA